MDTLLRIVPFVLAVLLAPFLRSVINKTKAAVGGRKGPPWLQPYRDFRKLIGKGAVYSFTTTWVFRAGPTVNLACLLFVLLILPFAGLPSMLAFEGDLLLFAYAMALARIFLVWAALDTGSPFEGMGASREVQFSALAEPVLLLCLVVLGREVSSYSLSNIYHGGLTSLWVHAPAVALLCVVALFVVMLSENSRIPVDDPTTHLELTMIHEVMVLDHSGPDLGFIEWAQALKLWVFAQLLVGLIMPLHDLPVWAAIGVSLAGMAFVAFVVGLTESAMARLRLLRVPELLFGSGALAVLAILLEVR